MKSPSKGATLADQITKEQIVIDRERTRMASLETQLANARQRLNEAMLNHGALSNQLREHLAIRQPVV